MKRLTKKSRDSLFIRRILLEHGPMFTPNPYLAVHGHLLNLNWYSGVTQERK